MTGLADVRSEDVPQFGDFLNEELPGASAASAPRPAGVKVAPPTEFEQWAEDPEQCTCQGLRDYLAAFIEDREDNAGVPWGKFGIGRSGRWLPAGDG